MPAIKLKILVVDDDLPSRELILEYLDGPDYEPVAASDGLEAWTILESQVHDFDVVLLDRMMPRMDGIEVLSRIKRHPNLKSLPVIMETAATDSGDVIEGINAGAHYYLTKPFDGEVLISMVRSAAHEYQRFRELRREVQQDAGMLGLMRTAVFEFRSPEQATDLGAFLAKACPDPERVVMGLSELMINAIEHGNLDISYEEKSALNRSGCWMDEISNRLKSEKYSGRVATVTFDRGVKNISISIKDQGRGFDPRPYLQIDPTRVFDSHGRGIAIANLLSFDNLEYCNNGTEVNASILAMASHTNQ